MLPDSIPSSIWDEFKPLCKDCNTKLTHAEEYFYSDRCEVCERKWMHRIEAWRLGGEDEELDEMFDAP